MRRSTSSFVLLCALLMALPAMPLQAVPGGGRSPGELTTFSDGRSSAGVMLEPLPSFNRTLSITLPWNANVSSASLKVQAVGRSITRTAAESASDLAAGTSGNLTLGPFGLELSSGSWGWDQSGDALGENCSVSGGAFDGGFRLNDTNPLLSASGGGVWLHRLPLVVKEQGGLARTNETVNIQLTFPAGEVVNPYKEVRLTDSAGAELPVFICDAGYSGHHCTRADAIFVVPSLAASSTDRYYIYFGNPAAGLPSYDRQVFLADSFSGPALAPSWTASDTDGLSYLVGGNLRVFGTASSEFWQGASFESSHELPVSFDVSAAVDVSSASGTGYFALLSVFQDAQNSIDLGIQYDSGVSQLTPAKFILGRTVAGTTSIDFASDAGGAGTVHTLSGTYSSGSFSGYIDGNLLGTVQSQLSSQRIRLSAAARAMGDSVDVLFDELLASSGYSGLSARDPALSVVPGIEEQAGYMAFATLTSPLIQNDGRLPFGTARLESQLPPGTDCTLSVLGPSNETLATGLVNGQSVPLDPANHPAFRLRAVLATTDPGATPLLGAWGIGDQWSAGLDAPGEYAALQNVTLSAGGIMLARSPELWNRSASAALNPGIASTFDSAGVSHPWVLYSDGIYRMYYAGFDGMHWRIGLATSPDGVAWTRYPDNPVLVSGGGWELTQVDWPCVVYNGSGYEMWYAGSSDGGATFSIGYATSQDGISWTRCASNPVITPGLGGDWDPASVFAPRVLFDGSNYTMLFAGKNATTTAIGELSSTDGIIWGWQGAQLVPVLAPPAAGWSSLGVVPGGVQLVPGKGYLMWYGGYNATMMGVGMASSPDGAAWTFQDTEPVLVNGDAASIDGGGATFPAVLFNGIGAMYYSAFDGSKWRIGQASACVCPEGSLLSDPVDLGTAPASLRLTTGYYAPENTSVSVMARSSQDGAAWSSWIALGGTPAGAPSGRYLQWTASFRSAQNDSTAVVQGAAADLVYRSGLGEVELPPVALPPSQDLTAVSAAASFSGDSVSVLESTDGGVTWTAIEPGSQLGISGTSLRMKVVLAGNYTQSPTLAGLSYSFTFNSFPSNCSLDMGADGTVEWSAAGLFTGAATADGLAPALNSYLGSHRNDTGDLRQIPLSFSSASSGLINATELKVEWSAMVLPDNPPSIDSQPPDRARVNELYIYDIDARDPDRRDRLTYSLEAAPEGMTISGNTGEITWTPNARQVGYQMVRIAVSDGQLNITQQYTLIVSLSPVNDPPVLTGTPPDRATVGYECSCQFNATDPDGDRVRFSFATGAPRGAAVDGDSGAYSWIPAMDQAGPRGFDLQVTDGIDTIHLKFTINVSSDGANNLPVVTSVQPPTARVNLVYSFNLSATDADNDSLSYYLIAGPGNATLSTDGTFSWTPSAADVGTEAASVKVSDGKGYTVYNFTVKVHLENRAPMFNNMPLSLKPSAGSEWTFTPMASDPDGDPVTFSLARGPAGMTVDSATGVLHWTPSPSQKGAFPVSLAASDGIATTYLNFTLTIKGGTTAKGFFEENGLMLVLLIAIIAATAGTAAAVSRRRRAPAARAAPGTALSKPRIIEPVEGAESGTAEGQIVGPVATLPPPEPQTAGVAEPMKPVSTVAMELPPVTAASVPPLAAAAPPVPPFLPVASPVTPATAPPPRKTPEIVRPSRQATAPAPMPRSPAPDMGSAAPAMTQESPPPPEPYTPIPGTYDETPLAASAALPSTTAPRLPPPPPMPPSPGSAGGPSKASTTSLLDSLVTQMEADGKPAATATPVPSDSKGEKVGLSEDMDFLRSFLSEKDKAREEKAVEGSPEGGALKQFTKEWETRHETGKAPAATPPAAPPAPPPQSSGSVQPTAPASGPAKKEGPKNEEPSTTLSLDDILNELEN